LSSSRLSSLQESNKSKIFLQEKAVEATKQKEEIREKRKPEENEGKPSIERA
jgi:hypothetical protein